MVPARQVTICGVCRFGWMGDQCVRVRRLRRRNSSGVLRARTPSWLPFALWQGVDAAPPLLFVTALPAVGLGLVAELLELGALRFEADVAQVFLCFGHGFVHGGGVDYAGVK